MIRTVLLCVDENLLLADHIFVLSDHGDLLASSASRYGSCQVLSLFWRLVVGGCCGLLLGAPTTCCVTPPSHRCFFQYLSFLALVGSALVLFYPFT